MTALTLLRRHAALVLLATFVLAAVGLDAIFRLPAGIYPDVDFPRIVAVAHEGDVSPELLETQVTRPLEEALATVPGVVRVRSRTIRGSVEVSLQFRPDSDMWRNVALARNVAARARSELPNDVDVEIERVTAASVPILTFNVTGADGRDLLEFALRQLRPVLVAIPGAGHVEIQGGDVREVEVVLRPEQLAGAGITPSELADRLTAQDVLTAVGRVEDGHQSLTLIVDSQATTLAAIAALPIARGEHGAVPLSTVADIRFGQQDRRLSVAGPAGDSVAVLLTRVPGASTSEVAAAARDAIGALRKQGAFPPGVTVEPVYDESILVDDSLHGVRDALLIGVALALLVMAAFLRDVRAGLTAAVALPTTLLATFASMRLFHQSLNLMSLGGLAVAIGLVIDDAIVIVEAIVRRLEEGLSPLDAARAGTGDLLAAVTGTTITTVVVFAPLGLLDGVIGTFFGSLATTLCAAVLLSLLFAVTLVPLVAGWLLKARAPKDTRARRRAFGSGYGRLLSSLVRRPLWVLPALVLLFAGGAVALTHMATGLLPPLDEGSFVLDFYLPPGTSLAETDRAVHRIDAVLARDPSVETFTRRTGAEMGPITATVQNRGDIMVRLVARDRRPPIDDVIARVREKLADAVPEVDVEFVQVLADVLDDLSGTARPIEVHVSGDDPALLEQVATEVGRRLEQEPRLADVFDGVEGQVPSLRLAVDPNAVQRFGVDPEHIGEDVRVMAEGRVVAQLRLQDRAYGIRVRFPDAVRFEANALLRVPLATDRGSLPLSSLVRVDRPLTPSARLREQLRPTVIVTADVPDGDLGAAEAAVHERLADVALPPGVTLTVAGKAEGARAAREQLLHVLGLGAALLLLVLVAQLRSFRLALLVLSSAPVGLVGALSTLALTGTALDVSSLMGCVLLAGLVVKNGILLLEHAQHRADELGFGAALVEAGARRLRPILMTTLATLAGLAPLALGLGAGSELQRPLALAVIGGLVVSTAVTLLALPPLAALSMRGKLEREVP